MTMFSMEPEQVPLASIKVVGVGGGGNNAVNTMIRGKLSGVEFFAVNTDLQSLNTSPCANRIQIGAAITKGLGAGARPELGRQSAIEDAEALTNSIRGSDMVFITAGMGGGTGTGAAPVVAGIAREMGILTIGVVTKPFHFEGPQRMRQAEEGLEQLRDVVDALLVVPNQKLLEVIDRKTPITQAFTMADDILRQAIQGISELIIVDGRINLDFADVRTILEAQGRAVMGIGMASGETRAVEAAARAISSPLLEDGHIKGARKVLINITGGSDLSLFEVTEASTIIQKEADPDAQIIFGTVIHDDYPSQISITVIATGFDAGRISVPTRRISSTERTSTPTSQSSGGGGWKAAPEMVPTLGGPLELDEEELDIPTFLRKRAD
jgi:cell division protein FtsZ